MNELELNRLQNCVIKEKEKGKFYVDFEVKCSENASSVLDNCKEIMRIVLRETENKNLALEEWMLILPNWFVKGCSKEMTEEEIAHRVTLPIEERVRLSEEEGWSLSDWLYWLKPEQRQWYWWNSEIIDSNTFKITVECFGSPFPWGALEWLVKSAGAIEIGEV